MSLLAIRYSCEYTVTSGPAVNAQLSPSARDSCNAASPVGKATEDLGRDARRHPRDAGTRATTSMCWLVAKTAGWVQSASCMSEF